LISVNGLDHQFAFEQTKDLSAVVKVSIASAIDNKTGILRTGKSSAVFPVATDNHCPKAFVRLEAVNGVVTFSV